MASVNTHATHKFAIVLNEKSPAGKLLYLTRLGLAHLDLRESSRG